MNENEIKGMIESAANTENGVLGEYEAKQIFSKYGIPVVPEIASESPEGSAEAAVQLGFPVVLKGVGPEILHKTERGMVKLGLTSEQEVADNARAMKSAAADSTITFLIQPQLVGRREFVVGVMRDPLFGPVILFGLGGIYTEVLNDTVLKIAPVNERDIDSMLDEFTSKELLGPFRGEEPVDRDTLTRIITGLSDLALQHPEIKEIDINPLIIEPDGGPVAVDGLIITELQRQDDAEPIKVNREAFRSCYYPRSVAFIGASGTISKWGHTLVANILSRDYQGEVYLVNPRGGTLMGKKVYRSVTEIEQPVELVVVTIPAQLVIDLLPQLQEKGVTAMLLISSGFRETGGKGIVLEQDLVAAAHRAGITIFGPNTMGICNPWKNFFCCGVHVYPRPGSTALVCQSGNMGMQLLAFAEQQDIGIRAFSGSGNEAMVTIEDYMEVFEDDEQTKTVVLYVESIKDGKRFFSCAKKVSKKKPIVILKGGRTQKGGLAASSHTGAIASNNRGFEAACSQAGLVQVRQPVELLDLSAVFSSLPMPKGNRVAIMTLGGGWGVVTTDLCLENNLIVPDLPEDIMQKLNTILPGYWSHGNPIDIVGENDPDIPKITMEELLKWDGCDAVIHLGIQGRRIMAERLFTSVGMTDPAHSAEEMDQFKQIFDAAETEYINHVVRLTEQYDKPVLGVSLLTDADTRTVYRTDNCRYRGVFFPSPERAVKALAGMYRYQRWKNNFG